MLGILTTLSMLLHVFLVSFIIDKYSLYNNISIIFFAVFAYLVLSLLNIWYYKKFSLYERDLLINIKEDYFKNIVYKSYEDFTKQPVGKYISNFNYDIDLVRINKIEPTLDLIYNSFLPLFALIYVFLIDFRLGFVFIIASLISTIPIILNNRRSLDMQNNKSKLMEEYSRKTNDIIKNLSMIHAYGIEGEFINSFKEKNKKISSAQSKWNITLESTRMLSYYLFVFITFAIDFYCIWCVINGSMSIGMVIAISQGSNMILTPISQICVDIIQIVSSKNIVNDISAKIKILPQVSNTTKISNSFLLKDLTYKRDENIILDKVNVRFDLRKKYAIVGKSGSGKSTLFKLLVGYYPIEDGEIFIDGKLCDSNFYHNFILVNQKNYVFNDTIKNNLTLYNDNIDDAHIWKVITEVGLLDRFNKYGLNATISENGTDLSGGEKQRINLARALLLNEPILLLDEITSNLDYITKKSIYNLILDLPKTVVMITHDIDKELLKRFDQVYVVEKSKVLSFENK